MVSTGAWAYGAEIAYADADFLQNNNELYLYTYTLDLKGRVGYAMDRALVYGVLGYGFSEYQDGTTAAEDLFDADGVPFGLGVEYLVSDSAFVGGEVLQRNLDHDYPGGADLTTFTLRAGMKF